MLRSMFWGLAALAGVATPAAAECRFGPIVFCDGCTLQRQITVPRGEACEFVGYINNGSFRGFQTVERPKRGSFGIHSPTFAAYRAAAKTGADRFVYKVKWEVGGRPHIATIVNTVTIVD